MGEDFGKIAGWIAGALAALVAIVAPFQTLLALSLPYLLLITAIATAAVAYVVAGRLAEWASAPKASPGFGNGAAQTPPRHSAKISIAVLAVICAIGAVGAAAEVHLLALRVKTESSAGNPVTMFYAPARAVKTVSITPRGADLTKCVPTNLSPRGAPPLGLAMMAWVPGDPRASLTVTDFVGPQAFALDCGSPDTYLPIAVPNGDATVLDGGQLLWLYAAICGIGGLIWLATTWQWGSRRRLDS